MADDSAFGPRLADSFDFTIVFEHVVLSILPSALFISASVVRLYALAGQPVRVKSGMMLLAKLATVSAFLCLQIVGLSLWITEPVSYRRFTIASSILGVSVAILSACLVWNEHKRCWRPSSLLSIYFSLTGLLDLAQARSLWLRPGLDGIAGVFAGTVATKLILCVLEEVPKTDLLTTQSRHRDVSISPEATGGLFDRTMFWWLNPLFKKGYKAAFGIMDLPALQFDHSSKHLSDQFAAEWGKDPKTDKHCLLWTTARAFRIQLVSAVVPRLAFGAVNLAQPFLVNRAIDLIDEPIVEFHQNIVGGLIGATALVYVGIALTRAIYRHLTFQLITMVRGALVSMIFQKTLELELDAVVDSAPITLMSTDIDGIHRGLQFLHDIWASVLAIGIGLYVLQQLLGYPAFLVIVPSFVCTAGAHFLSKSMAPAMADWNLAVQERVGASSSMLAQMKGINMMGLTEFMRQSIQALRIYELDLSKRFRWLQSSVATVASSISLVSPIAVIVSTVYLSGGLGVARAFTALSVMALITEPLALLLASWPILRASVACFDRIQAFLLLEDHRAWKDRTVEPKSGTVSNEVIEAQRSPCRKVAAFRGVDLSPLPARQSGSGTNGDDVIEMHTASFRLENGNIVLHNIDMRVPEDQLTMVIGGVGSGKSSLLKAMIGEIPLVSGNLHVRLGSVAYCDQIPWLRNVSVRDNILAESPMDDVWYARVTEACELQKDFLNLPDGDMTCVGSGGVSLSGGQKQRVALARAVFSRKALLIADDCFSGLDAHTANIIFENLWGPNGLLRQNRVTAVVATHALQLARKSDLVTVLNDGRIQYNQARPDSMNSSIWGTIKDGSTADNDPEGVKVAQKPECNNQRGQTSSAARPTHLETDEEFDIKRTGDKTLYVFYAKSIGVTFCVLWLLLSITFVLGSVAPQIWLRFWTEHGTHSQKDLYAGIYAALSLCGVVGAGVAVGFFLVLIIPKSAQNLHLLLLKHVLEAPLYFFIQTDTGNILNRFSQDMTQIDQVLPLSAIQTGFGALGVLAKLGLVASGASYVATAFPFVFAALWVLQKCYLRTSRQIRHMDLEYKAPLYTAFTETLAGLATVRAFAWQESLTINYLQLLDASQKAYYLMFCLQRWLNVVLDLFTAGLAVLLVGIALNLPGSTTKGAIGLAMVNLIDLNTSLNSLIMSWTNLEISLGALARLKSFIERTPKEAQDETDCQTRPEGWPARGEVVFEDVTAGYSPGSEPALQKVSLRIQPGQKVAICGRTGSGKSSLILTLLRFLEVRRGIIRIDGIDISVLSRQSIRHSLTTIPQDPVTLTGTVRDNLDPQRKFAADSPDLEAALAKVGISSIVSGRGGLDAPYRSMGFSTGHKQLFCLARSLLQKSRLILLDEATSGVDKDTESTIRSLMRQEFQDSTVLEVVHRLDAVMDYDVLVTMEDGRITEARALSDPSTGINNDLGHHENSGR